MIRGFTIFVLRDHIQEYRFLCGQTVGILHLKTLRVPKPALKIVLALEQKLTSCVLPLL